MKNKKLAVALCACLGLLPAAAQNYTAASVPDSVYLFSYATRTDDGRSGLRLAWSRTGSEWFSIGGGQGFLKCDYGAWGREKRMFAPSLLRDSGGVWHCVWQLNDGGQEFAHAQSANLTDWNRQRYFTRGQYDSVVLSAWTRYPQRTAVVNGQEENGTVQRVAWTDVRHLLRYADHRAWQASLNNERTEQDAVRFAGLKPVDVEITLHPESEKAISDKLVGVFFEDINYGADGGLYAELIQNRGFEYTDADHRGWTSTTAWQAGNGASLSIATETPVHANNPHYAVLTTPAEGGTLVNGGFDGIALRGGRKYDFSWFARSLGKAGKVDICLVSPQGEVLASRTLSVVAGGWKKQTAVLTPKADADSAWLSIRPHGAGQYALDMVSLFPRDTYKGRRNGLRADLAQAIADIHPRFVRFPGGCVAHGNGLDNMYRWKNSIGPLEARKPMPNLWGYHQTLGLGFYEYFLFCEDMGAEPLPVLAAGVPCQNSACAPGKLLGGGQQGGIPMDQMDEYIQDVLDLIDYANGDPRTSRWARMRAEAGHPEPFNLKYIGIGNEDLITDVFEERFTLIYQAVKKAHPEITVVGTVGPFYEGTDYEEGWDLARRLQLPMVDEHYYNTPGWFINNQDFYDHYDRAGTKVYLGEYAAHLPGRPNNLETALAEALYLTSVERNGDVVAMTSYAPLLAKEGHTQWNPDLIYFNNREVKPTVGYYVQQLYGQNSGTAYLPAEVKTHTDRNEVRVRIASSVVKDEKTGDVVLKLVNLLPVEAPARIDLGTAVENHAGAVKTVLTGRPDDKQTKPVTEDFDVPGSRFGYTLPPYSFTVIRFRMQADN